MSRSIVLCYRDMANSYSIIANNRNTFIYQFKFSWFSCSWDTFCKITHWKCLLHIILTHFDVLSVFKRVARSSPLRKHDFCTWHVVGTSIIIKLSLYSNRHHRFSIDTYDNTHTHTALQWSPLISLIGFKLVSDTGQMTKMHQFELMW